MRPAARRPGASRGRAARLLAVVCLSVGVLVGGAAAGSPASAAVRLAPGNWQKQCDAPALGLGKDAVQFAPVLKSDTLPGGGPIVRRPLSNGTWVPVIMVHGWTSKDTHNGTGAFDHRIDLSDVPGFSPDITRSLIGQLQRIHGAAVFTFDYHPYSARWVDDPHLGPALGKVIDCLYRASGKKVIIVAHSMGGLIARYAATHPGATGTDRSGEISSVVTFGTPETGSLAALLTATGINVGASVSHQIAVIRLVLSACGKLAAGDIKAGTLCDTLPAPVRAFASSSGIALRTGSSQLAALKPWPSSIRVTALAGNVTFELPDPGWFSLPWDTKAVDVGDMIVTPGSALAGATTTGNATCDYQLNLVRGTTDQVGVWLGMTASSQVAQQPLGSFAGACFHTNLMRGLELANDADGAVSDAIAAESAPPASSVAAITPSGRLSSVSGIIKADGGYWFAAASQPPAAAVTVVVYRWNGRWQRQATVPITGSGGIPVSGILNRSTPITVQPLTNAAAPDFLIHSFGADTDWLNVVSEAAGRWAAVPFDDSGGRTLGENVTRVSGRIITVGYDSCIPNCAAAHVTTVRFQYSGGAFVPVDPPGSCTGEALAQSAHASAPSGNGQSDFITGVTCANGYAAAGASNGNWAWTITFKSTGTGWKLLASGNILPTTGIPSATYQALRNGLSGLPQNEYYPY